MNDMKYLKLSANIKLNVIYTYKPLISLSGGEFMKYSVEDLDFSKVNDKLKHLSKFGIVEIINAYYEGVKTTTLIDEFQIDVRKSSLYKIFPPERLDLPCKYCYSPMLLPLKSKSGYNSYNNINAYCSICEHTNDVFCQCENCNKKREKVLVEKEKARKEELKKNKEIIDSILQSKKTKVPEESLSLEDRLYLSVILRATLSEELNVVLPLAYSNTPIASTSELESEVIKALTARKIMVLDPSNDCTLFNVDREKNSISFNMLNVKYKINVESRDGSYNYMIERLMYPRPDDFEEDNEFCYEMWKKISLGECLEFLLHQMDKVGYDFSPGKKTTKVFMNLLDHFSAAQINSIIFRAVANSTKRYQEGNITKIHAQNLVISSCEFMGERAIAEGWNLRVFSRNYNLPESLLSKVFFTSILKIADLGFEEKPTKNI